MGGMILCRSEYSKIPYYIEGADINVYSIEEISFCIMIYILSGLIFSAKIYLGLLKRI